jgi:hypothetical protein
VVREIVARNSSKNCSVVTMEQYERSACGVPGRTRKTSLRKCSRWRGASVTVSPEHALPWLDALASREVLHGRRSQERRTGHEERVADSSTVVDEPGGRDSMAHEQARCPRMGNASVGHGVEINHSVTRSPTRKVRMKLPLWATSSVPK